MPPTGSSNLLPELEDLLRRCEGLPLPPAADYSQSRPYNWDKDEIESACTSATLGGSAMRALPPHAQAFSQALHSFNRERGANTATDKDTGTHPLPVSVTSSLSAWPCLNMPMGGIYGANAQGYALSWLNQVMDERKIHPAAGEANRTIERYTAQSAVSMAVGAAATSDRIIPGCLAGLSDPELFDTAPEQWASDLEPMDDDADQHLHRGLSPWSNLSLVPGTSHQSEIFLPVFGGRSVSSRGPSPSPLYNDHGLIRPSVEGCAAASIGAGPVTSSPPDPAAVPIEQDSEGCEDMYLFGQSEMLACEDHSMIGSPYSRDCDDNGSLHCPQDDMPRRTWSGDSAIDLQHGDSASSPDVLTLLKLVEMTSDASRSQSPSIS